MELVWLDLELVWLLLVLVVLILFGCCGWLLWFTDLGFVFVFAWCSFLFCLLKLLCLWWFGGFLVVLFVFS